MGLGLWNIRVILIRAVYMLHYMGLGLPFLALVQLRRRYKVKKF